MEVTVRTLNSAKLKWKLSRMILFRVRAQRGKLKWNTFWNLSYETEANKFPLEPRSKVSLFYCRFSLSIDRTGFRHCLVISHAKDDCVLTKYWWKAIYSDLTRIACRVLRYRLILKPSNFKVMYQSIYYKTIDKEFTILNIYRIISLPLQFLQIFREITRKRGNAKDRAASTRVQLAGWSCIQYLLPFTLLIMPADRSCRCEYPGSG